MFVHLMKIPCVPSRNWAASESCSDVVVVVVFDGARCVRVDGVGADRDGKLEGRLGDVWSV